MNKPVIITNEKIIYTCNNEGTAIKQTYIIIQEFK